jgi:serine/threonine protein phosphatase 1
MADLAEQMFALIEHETAEWDGETIVVVLGDYIDSGPHSKDVIELLIGRSRSLEQKMVILRGNHEDILLRFLDQPDKFGSQWLELGGATTMSSYGVNFSKWGRRFSALRTELVSRLPIHHLAFLQSLPLTFQTNDFFFCHAGARPGISLNKQTERDLLWLRWPPGDSLIQFEKIVVHGHTPVAAPLAIGSRINVDTGAYATGRLSAVRITPDGFGFLTAEAAQTKRRLNQG